ncbi:MAG: type II toxin-antitoxin system RelB/DinJ family antitoxin [Chloroflexi bacterium]|nr:type II toxin-antitoxin system RelB/DinJ family antitoxin [Chloroflexota bacterium]
MTKTATITVRLDPKIKSSAEAVLSELGLTTTQAVTLFFNQVSLNKGLPFAVEIPSDELLEALADTTSRRNLKTFDDANAALKYLGI